MRLTRLTGILAIVTLLPLTTPSVAKASTDPPRMNDPTLVMDNHATNNNIDVVGITQSSLDMLLITSIGNMNVISNGPAPPENEFLMDLANDALEKTETYMIARGSISKYDHGSRTKYGNSFVGKITGARARRR